MIEKIFVVFVIMETFGLILHIIDSIRCWTDWVYYRKRQAKVDENDSKIEKFMERYSMQVEYLVSSNAILSNRIDELENKNAEKGE